jgi:hypothetical protein
MKGPTEAAFKARTKQRPRGPGAEVAAYRLARLLGLTNVPPAVSRSLPLGRLRGMLHPDDAGRWPEILERLQVRGGMVEGAAIHWVPGLTHLGVDLPGGVQRWKAWLQSDGVIAPEERSLAVSVSAMVVFDYLVGNAARFSGENIRGEVDGRRLFLTGHAQAFSAPTMTLVEHRTVLGHLFRTERFSRSLVQHLAGIDEAWFRRELAADPHHARHPLLFESQVRAFMVRHRTVVSYVSSLIAEHGEDRVLVFP